jgi:hypothetical protein
MVGLPRHLLTIHLLEMAAHSRSLHYAALCRKSLPRKSIHTEIPPLRSPEFLSRLVALANFMRLSLMKAAHVDLSDVAKQEFGYAPVGMTRGEERFQGRRLLSRSRFSSPWVGRRPIYTSVGMTNLLEGRGKSRSLRYAPVGMTNFLGIRSK